MSAIGNNHQLTVGNSFRNAALFGRRNELVVVTRHYQRRARYFPQLLGNVVVFAAVRQPHEAFPDDVVTEKSNKRFFSFLHPVKVFVPKSGGVNGRNGGIVVSFAGRQLRRFVPRFAYGFQLRSRTARCVKKHHFPHTGGV